MTVPKFGRYEIKEEIGDGAMGRVYRAWDPSVSRVVALKTVKSEYLTRENGAEYLKRFRREAQAAGGLNHPSIVRVFDVGENFLVMEFVEGRTLQNVIREDGRFSPEGALRLLGPVAQAIDHAHRAGIVHRDIKPANIMVQPDGTPKLMDFGVAHLEASVMTTAGQILGSPSYMAPEQIAGMEITGRSDVYSLAVVAYEMLTGQTPFQGTITQVIYRVMNEPAPPPRQLNATLPKRYDDVFAKALEKSPARRYATASEFVSALDIKELEFALSQLPASPSPKDGATPAAATPGVAERRPVRRSTAIGVGIGLVVALGAGSLFLLGRSGQPVAPPAVAGTASPAPVASEPPAALPSPAPSPVAPTSTVPSAASSATPRARPAPAASATPSPRRPAPTPAATPSPRPPAPTPAATPSPAPVVEGQLVELGPDVTPPRKTVDRTAPYPAAARRLHLNGSVTVGFVVDEHGMPIEIAVIESAGPVLDASALESVRGWRYEPARKDGVKVKVRWVEKLTYRLN